MLEETEKIYYYDVIIVGGGPAGCSAALALKSTGLKVAILDKSEFPREKVCGELMQSNVIKTLLKMSPEIGTAFNQFEKKTQIKRRRQRIELRWHVCIARID